MRRTIVVASLLLGLVGAAGAQVSIGISTPGVSIGINVPSYPRLVRVPTYPVYYAPNLQANFFFYDGMYWVFQGDLWYASSWYNGPWAQVAPQVVPYYVLRVPVRYYRNPPRYFRSWRQDAPPRWDQRWGPSWQQERRDWNQWNRRSMPVPAPLPYYQREYRGDRYPSPDQQPGLRDRNYRYQPRDEVVRQYYQDTTPRRDDRKDDRRDERPGNGRGRNDDRGGRNDDRDQGGRP